MSVLFVGNLPWETGADEIRELFAPCGTIVSCEVPVGRQNRSRGYALVEFSSPAEASSAVQSLHGAPARSLFFTRLLSRPAPLQGTTSASATSPSAWTTSRSGRRVRHARPRLPEAAQPPRQPRRTASASTWATWRGRLATRTCWVRLAPRSGWRLLQNPSCLLRSAHSLSKRSASPPAP